MDKKRLQIIFFSEYRHESWREVLVNVFGARNLHQHARKINIHLNDIAESAQELGFFNTSDDRVIGLYEVELTSSVKIERKKVGLRKLLRNIYENDVDGALVVFVQNDKWRLSFISEIRVINDDGSVDKKVTEPKRFTYLLGAGEKTKTPTDRLAALAGKKIALEDIRTAFSVEALNNEFYKDVAEYFYDLVGSKTGKGKDFKTHKHDLELPGHPKDDPANRELYQRFAVRLIGRTIFCWFLKKKESKSGVSLLPEKLLSSDAVRKNNDYYHSVLEPLFFQTLNTPIDLRISELPDGCETVPFLNGGLFEDQPEDFYNSESKTGYYQQFALKIPNEWFEGFFQKLEEYNFTIDENSPVEIEISVDPEMLGRIFENLLAEIDPDSGETARKATGSFYTPREIVNYMVDESLMVYLKSELREEPAGYQSLKNPQATLGGNDWRVGQPHLEYALNQTHWQGDDVGLEKALQRLFSYDDTQNPFDETDTKKLINIIDRCKVFDPACGSGAFPMGVLHRLVFLLGKLDEDGKKWKKQQKEKALEGTEKAFDEGDKEQRRRRLEEIRIAFDKDSSDFGRKLFLIENCLYGVDLQPIAAEISKLRCFLTLIVDEDVTDDLKDNRGVKPLPNLEFKFVTADALLKLPEAEVQGDLFNTEDKERLEKLENLRHAYIQSFGKQKEKIKKEFVKIQDEIRHSQLKNSSRQNRRSLALSTWEPFSYDKVVDWFDPLWMFGVKGFDIAIGNPPYVQLQKEGGRLAKRYEKQSFETFIRTGDIYSLFYEKGFELLKENGILCYITSNKWMRANYGEKTRRFFAEKTKPILIVDFGNVRVFQTAVVDNNILILQKAEKETGKSVSAVRTTSDFDTSQNLADYVRHNTYQLTALNQNSWVIGERDELDIKGRVEEQGTPLEQWDIRINYGLKTGLNDAFIVSTETKKRIEDRAGEYGEDKSAQVFKRVLRGKDIKAWFPEFSDLWLVYIPWHFPLHEDPSITGASQKAEASFKAQYRAVYEHLLKYKSDLSRRNQAETGIRYEWYALQRFGSNYWRDFELPKIIYPNMTKYLPFIYDETGFYTNDKNFIIVGDNLKYLTCFFNSKLFKYCFSDNFPELQGGTRELRKVFFDKIPVKKISDDEQKPFNTLVDYLTLLKGRIQNLRTSNNDHKEELAMSLFFEQLSDALILETFLTEDFLQSDISIKKNLPKFNQLDNLSEDKTLKEIKGLYQKIEHFSHPLRANLSAMKSIPSVQVIYNTVRF